MSRVNHAEATELFSAYLERDLPPEQAGALEEHLQGCEPCRRELQDFERTVGALGTVHKMAAPPEFLDGVRDRIRKRSRGRFFSTRRAAQRVPYELFSLVMLALILAIYLALQLMQPQLRLP